MCTQFRNIVIVIIRSNGYFLGITNVEVYVVEGRTVTNENNGLLHNNSSGKFRSNLS